MSGRRSYDQNIESVSSRRNLAFIMLIVVTVCATVYIIFSRLSNDALSLVIGIGLGGLLTGIPLALAVYGFLRYQSNKSERRESYNPQPIILQIPSQQNSQPALPDNSIQWTINHERRQVSRDWDVLGDSD